MIGQYCASLPWGCIVLTVTQNRQSLIGCADSLFTLGVYLEKT